MQSHFALNLKSALFIFLMMTSSIVVALPIDWHGAFGVDTMKINRYRRSNAIANGGDASQVISPANGQNKDASFQSYILKLQPTMIINDSISWVGEISSGYARGGFLGDSSAKTEDGTLGNSLYHHNTSQGTANLVITKMNLELYSDTGTYIIGRQPTDWGLGVVYNDGDKIWDRHATIRDGIVAKWKLGYFLISPYWFLIDSTGTLTKETQARDYGISLLYDNIERDLAFGVLFGKKKSYSANTTVTTDVAGGTTASLAGTNVKITDIFLRKTFGDFTLAVEAPIFSGEIGDVYQNNNQTKLKSNAIIAETKYKLSDAWSFGLNGGKITGDNGAEGDFEAMFLHPNYQLANLMFRYNLSAISDTTNNANVYDSHLTNMTYAKFHTSYRTDNWLWSAAFIWAKAAEVAGDSGTFFNHTTNVAQTAAAVQSDDLGYEIDLNFEYYWNANFTLSGGIGYHLVGDYYAHNNTATPQEVDNTYNLFLQGAASF